MNSILHLPIVYIIQTAIVYTMKSFYIRDHQNQVTQTHYEAEAYTITHVP
jgi:hypothetical protein